jgi:nitroreductase
MELKEAINKRKSCRRFSGKKIPPDVIREIIDYAYKIPSAGNLKPLELFYIEYIDITYIVICADFKRTTVKYGERGISYVYTEAGHTAQNICLIAQEYGLGTCCVGAFNAEKIKKDYNLQFDPIYTVAIGYPSEN